MYRPTAGRKLFVAIFGSLVLVAGWAWSQRATPKQSKAYEYWVVEVDIEGSTFPGRVVQERLNKLGAGGWELVNLRDTEGERDIVWLFMTREAP